MQEDGSQGEKGVKMYEMYPYFFPSLYLLLCENFCSEIMLFNGMHQLGHAQLGLSLKTYLVCLEVM